MMCVLYVYITLAQKKQGFSLQIHGFLYYFYVTNYELSGKLGEECALSIPSA